MTQVSPEDDLVAAFQIEGWPVRGRIVRLGEAHDAAAHGPALDLEGGDEIVIRGSLRHDAAR